MKAWLIHNPMAGPRYVEGELEQAQRYLVDHGWQIAARRTERAGHARELARAAADRGCDAVLVAGGDGTINEVVNGLAYSETAMGVLPVGTGNVWAKQLGLPTYSIANPFRIRDAAAAVMGAPVRRVDLGRVGERYFLCWAGIGLDAQVTARMEPRSKRTKQLGALAYLIALFFVARDFTGVRTRVVMDGKVVLRRRMLLVLASNIRLYTGLANVAREACIDDGLLDLYGFEGLGAPYIFRHILQIFSGRYLRDPRVFSRQVRQVEVQTAWPVPVHADGEPIGMTPVTLLSVPGALRVFAPSTAPQGLFRSPPQ